MLLKTENGVRYMASGTRNLTKQGILATNHDLIKEARVRISNKVNEMKVTPPLAENGDLAVKRLPT